MNDNDAQMRKIDLLHKERTDQIKRLKRLVKDVSTALTLILIGLGLLWFAWPLIAFIGKIVLQGLAILFGGLLLIAGIAVLLWVIFHKPKK